MLMTRMGLLPNSVHGGLRALSAQWSGQWYTGDAANSDWKILFHSRAGHFNVSQDRN